MNIELINNRRMDLGLPKIQVIEVSDYHIKLEAIPYYENHISMINKDSDIESVFLSLSSEDRVFVYLYEDDNRYDIFDLFIKYRLI